MFNYLSKTLLRRLRPPFLSLRFLSTTSNQQSFTVSYLINSCGLSPESASSVSKYFNLESSTTPDSVIDMFKNLGCSRSHVSRIVRRFPRVLMLHPERTLLPKINYLCSVGLSGAELVKVIDLAPQILLRNLKECLIPNFNALRDVLQCDKRALASFRRYPMIMAQFKTTVLPRMKILREEGMPEKRILYLLHCHPWLLGTTTHDFKEILARTKRMGVNPQTATFSWAMLAVARMNESSWERKFDAYGRWGWSRHDAMAAFVRDPRCILLSEKKIMAMMEFFVETMGFESLFFVQRPWVLSMSLEKRIIPRCSVLKLLQSEGMINKDFSLYAVLLLREDEFFLKFVTPHLEKAPQLLSLYQEKRGPVQGALS